MSESLTIEYVRNKTREISACELLSSEYKGNQVALHFRCACGATFWRTWNDFQDRGRTRCNACAKKKQYAAKRLSGDDVRERLKQRGYEWIDGEYVNQKSKLRVRCKCGHERTGTYSNLIGESHEGLCSTCARSASQKLDIHLVATICELVYGIECLENTWTDAKTLMRFRCHCGKEFTACWNNVCSGGQRQCADCSGAVSRGENAVRTWLEKHGYQYEMQKRFPDCAGKKPYPFDFFLSEEKLCIEFDGEQHFHPVAFGGGQERFEEIKARDAAKDAYCAAKGYRMLRISYKDFSRVDEILSAMLIPR